MSEDFGEKLRKLRIDKGFTLEELATRAGSTKAYIWQLENKSPARPSAELLLKIANTLGVSPDFLLDDSVVEPTKNQLADALFRKVKERKLSKADMDILLNLADSLGKNETNKRSK
jgi:transcriptional regulator with XRE-family HTH domain